MQAVVKQQQSTSHIRCIAKRIVKLISFTLIQNTGIEIQEIALRVDVKMPKFSFTDTRNRLSKFVLEFLSILHFYDVLVLYLQKLVKPGCNANYSNYLAQMA